MRLRWIKISSGVWVDEDAFYSVRLRGRDRDGNRLAKPVFEAWTIFPGCMSRELGEAPDLVGAKRLAQLDNNDMYADPGSEEAA